MRRHPPGGPASVRQWSNGHPTFCGDNLDNSLPWRQEHKSQVTTKRPLTLTTQRSFFHELMNWQIFVGGPPQLTAFAQVGSTWLRCGRSTSTTSVVSRSARPPEDRRRQRDCQSMITFNASLRYFVSFDSRSGTPHASA